MEDIPRYIMRLRRIVMSLPTVIVDETALVIYDAE